MKCPNCGNDNSAATSICEWCGGDLVGEQKRKTVLESDDTPQAPPVQGPGAKRKTMFEPDTGPSMPAASPARGAPEAPPGGAPPQPASPNSSPSAPADFFGSLPPRSPLSNANDPFHPVGGSPAAQTPQPAGPPAGPRAVKSKTIIDTSGAGEPQRSIQGALFLYAHAQDPGAIRPLFGGRNTIGRDDSRDVVLDDGRVSSEHGFLFLRGDGGSYVDTSTNGSMVDGQVIQGTQVDVRHGSVLTLGNLRAVLVLMPRHPFEV